VIFLVPTKPKCKQYIIFLYVVNFDLVYIPYVV